MITVIVSARYVGPTNNKGSRMRVKLAGYPARFYSYSTEWEDRGAFDCIRQYAQDMRSQQNVRTFVVTDVSDARSAPDGHDTLHIVRGFDKPPTAR